MSVLEKSFSHEEALWSLIAPLRRDLPAGACIELLGVCLLLRWTDQMEAEQEAIAVFEDRSHAHLLPPWLEWRQLVRLEDPEIMAQRLTELAVLLNKPPFPTGHLPASYLNILAAPLLHALENLSAKQLTAFVHGIDSLPFETASERRALLEPFDLLFASERHQPWQRFAKTALPLAAAVAGPVGLAAGSALAGALSGLGLVAGKAFQDFKHEKVTDPDLSFTSLKSVARLAAALANPQPGERVYDPCFGSATFLVAAWLHAEANRHESQRLGPLLDIAGVELDPSAFLLGLTRMVLAGIDNPRLELGNSLEREALSSPSRQGFDVVLANPPLGVKTNRDTPRYQHFPIRTPDSVGLFIQHALSQLKPHGRAVIVVPEGFLFRAGAERELRRQLVERGQVEAVVGLPAGAMSSNTMIKSALLVLTQAGGAQRVRMMDTAPLFESRSAAEVFFIRSELARQLADELRRPICHEPSEGPITNASEQNRPFADQALPARLVWEQSLEELAATDWDLTPRRREKGGLEDLLANIKESLGESGAITPLSAVAQITAGRSIKPAQLVNEPPSERAVGYVRIKDLSQDKVGRCSSWLIPDLAETERRWALAAGDVLVSKSGTIGKMAMVRNGAVGAVAANGLYVLRADQSRLDPGFLLAYLASPACKNWLAAQSRGTVIQHLNRPVLEQLPIPLPPLTMQAQAAMQYRDFGTDALAFLAQATGSDGSDRLTVWLAELSHRLAKMSEKPDGALALSQLEPLVSMAMRAQEWIKREQFEGPSRRWLEPLTDALLRLVGVADIPPGPGLLSVLQDADRHLWIIQEVPSESQVQNIAQRLSDWLRAAIAALTDPCEIGIRTDQSQLLVGSFAEFSVDLVNEGVLPLRMFRVETTPDWGAMESAYVPEHGVLKLNLRGDSPKLAGNLALNLRWAAQNLVGREVNGTIELNLQVVESAADDAPSITDLGGSPYVTGTPLEPMHGHSVFFGREQLIAQISRQVATHGNVVLLEGNRRAGKTSVLKHLEGRDVVPGWLAVHASLQGAKGAEQAVGVPTAGVFRIIAREIATALIKLKIETPLPNGAVGKSTVGVAKACREGISDEAPFDDLREYLEVVLSILEPLGLGLLLMLDEFDKLQEGIDNGVTSPQVPENIRFLIQTYPKFSAILTGSRRLKRLREEYWSALYGLGTSISVTALDEASARRVVTEPVRDKLIYSNEAIERIVQVTARQPYLMQFLCNQIFEHAFQTKARSITLGIVNEVAAGMVRDNEHFATLWDYAGFCSENGRRRQLILMLCARGFKHGVSLTFGGLHEQLAQSGVDVLDERLDADLAYLRELDLIDLAGAIGEGYYRLAIPLMADWMEQQQDEDVVISRARLEAEEEND